MQKASLLEAGEGGKVGTTSLNTDIAAGRCIGHKQEIEVGSAST